MLGLARSCELLAKEEMSLPTIDELNQAEEWWNNHSEKERDEAFLTNPILRNHYFLHKWNSLTHSEQNMVTQFLKERGLIQSEKEHAKDN